jgi:hypothetical protein
MPSILIEDLTEKEMRQLRMIKAEGNYRTWREMFLDKLGVKSE